VPELPARAEAARAVAAQLDADAIVCLATGVHSYLHANAVFLVTGFKSIGPSAAVVDRTGAVTLIVAPEWDASRAEEALDGAGAVIGCEELGPALSDVLAPMARLAVVGLVSMPVRIRALLEEIAELVPADDELEATARVKTARELELAARASAIAEAAFEALLGELRPGLREYELVAQLDAEMVRRGADDNFLLMSSSPVGTSVRAPTARRLEPGDTVLLEFSPSCEGQFTQLCRTIVLGEPGAQQRSDYGLLQVALDQAVAAARPGATVEDVVLAMDCPLEEAGLGAFCRPPYMRVRGHGQGLASVWPGDIARGNHAVLEKGMVFVLHPNQFFPESGYLLCGDPVVVNGDGGQRLTRRRPELESL
jgi:Xaa-Pro dipeptidase